jgi:hypothetical protein
MKIGVILAGMIMIGQNSVLAQTAFKPGEIWQDNNGVHINAHGGGVLLHEETYYWFGEHKSLPVYLFGQHAVDIRH